VKHVLVVGSGPQPRDIPLPLHLREIALPGMHWRLENTRIGGFPYTPLDALMTEAGHVDAVLRLCDSDTEAVLVDTFGEYGLEAMRSSVDVPVVGAAESGLAEARSHGDRFAIVTVWPESLDWLYRRQLLRHEASARCIGIRYLGGTQATEKTPVETLGAMQRGEPHWLERIRNAMRELEAQGASSIVLGCTCMSPIWPQLQDATGIPVICAARAGARGVLTALRTDDRTHTKASAASLEAFSNWMERGAAGVPPEESPTCPVCIADPSLPTAT